MAKLECELQGDFSLILSQLEDEIINGSISASLEEKSDFCSGSAYCAVRVYERYSFTGGNRVSLSLTLCKAAAEFFFPPLPPGEAKRFSGKLISLVKKPF